jgi:hypothetical protein
VVNHMRRLVIPLSVGLIHFIGVCCTALIVQSSSDGQAPLIWAIWAVLDFPWPFLLLSQLSGQPVILFGIIGSLWWSVLVWLGGSVIRDFRARHAK